MSLSRRVAHKRAVVLDRDGLESCSGHAQATACVTLGAGPTSLLLNFLLCNTGVILLVSYGCCQVDSTSRRRPSTKPGTNWALYQDHFCSVAHISGATAVCWVLSGALGDMESAGSQEECSAFSSACYHFCHPCFWVHTIASDTWKGLDKGRFPALAFFLAP